AYYAWPDQLEGGYEPKIARATLAAFIADARENGAALDLLTRTKVARVLRDGTAVTGVEIANAPSGATRTVRCKILVEATEYGDILPLSGARYRVAGTTSDKLPSEKANPAVLQARALAKSLIAEKDVFEKLLKHGGSGLAAGTPAAAEVVRKLAAALRKAGKTGAADRLDAATPEVFQALLASILQYHTWCGVIREYPEGVPGHLLLKTPPPGYDPARYANKQLHGAFVWGAAGRDVKGPRDYRVEFAWRGMADSDSPANGALTFHRHTQCGLNGGDQDYPVTVDAIETPAERRLAEREGILRTLSKIYYYQRELGLPWAVAEDEGYDTPANRALMREMNLPPDLYEHAVRLPQHPYARESRRGIGLHTLKASELSRWENARHFQTSVAMGDYYMDLDHGPTGHAAEKDVDGDLSAPGSLPRGGGPFQVPFGVFVPESVDGLVLAEKNISQSRIANGATRLQPVTMLTGQAAGAIAALSVREKKQPRRLNPIAVQSALLDAGSNLIQRWFGDVPWGSPLWRATQILALHKVMDPPGPFNKKRGEPVGGGNLWRPDEPLARDDADAAVRRLAKLSGKKTAAVAAELPAGASRGAFAIAAAGWLVKNCEPEGAP
ncbi:MAG: FAD-dependent oxidoreductase, partial [Opitutaceae bacterium]|nr:FAD-dependent oxidoreductase [Opitutaceae bacterium]